MIWNIAKDEEDFFELGGTEMGFFSDEDEEWKEQVKCFRKVIYPRGISEDVKQEAEDKVYSTVKKWKLGFDILIFLGIVDVINNGFTTWFGQIVLITWIGIKIVEAWGRSKVVDVAKQLQYEKDKQSEQVQE